MSVSSFPRPEHISTLLAKIEERISARGIPIEVKEAGLNHYRCEYKFGLRRRGEEQQAILSIHFQYAERMLADGSDAEVARIIEKFLDANF